MSTTIPSLSAQLYTVREFLRTPAEFARSIRRIRSIGYQAAEISSVENLPPADVKRILDEEGVAISGCHWEWDPLLARLDGILDQCRAWGCRDLLLTMMPESYAREGAPGFRRFVEEVRTLGEKVFQAGFTISYHNHNYEFARFDGRTGLEWIMQETGPRQLGMQIDTYWVQMGGGDPVEWIRKAAGRMPAVHLKDLAVDMWTPITAEVGQGNLDWARIIAACRKAGVRWYVVEQDECRRDPFESLKLSYDFLTSFGLS